jgi:hypothetical protein
VLLCANRSALAELSAPSVATTVNHTFRSPVRRDGFRVGEGGSRGAAGLRNVRGKG